MNIGSANVMRWAVVGWFALALGAVCARAQDAQQIMGSLVAHEMDASGHKGYYEFMNEEKSERTGGHTWVEKVAETRWGKVRFLIAEDGRPLSPDRVGAERGRLAAEANDPEGFRRQEAAKGDDEMHARQMLTLLPKAFLFDGPSPAGEFIRIGFRPNPSYSPQGLEERVLHGMSGFVLIDPKLMRMRELDGRVPEDISIGFGILATVKAGSNFTTVREHEDGYDWKTYTVHTDINGKAMFLKTIARQQESKHTNYRKIPDDTTVAQAVAMVEQ